VQRQIEEINKLYENGEDVTNHIFFTGSRLVNKDRKILTEPKQKELQKKASRVNNVSGNEYLVAEPTKNNFHGCGCLVHKSVFERLGAFDENLRLLNDFDLWYRLYTGGCKVHYIPEILVMGRVHSAQVSTSIGYSYHNPEQDMFWNRSLDWLLKNHPNNYELFVMYGKNAYRKTRYSEGDKAFAHAKELKKSGALWFKKCICKTEGHLLSIGKKVYLKLMKK
jgi:GT2 family glycosyltransferase